MESVQIIKNTEQQPSNNQFDPEQNHNKMINQQTNDLKLISLPEAIAREDINIEILNKLRFLITNKYINPYVFKINLETGIFYNIETNEVFEVIKNTNTNQYEIRKDSEKTYEEQLTNKNIKVRRLEKISPHMGNAAFTKVGFLIINILTFSILTTMIILLNK